MLHAALLVVSFTTVAGEVHTTRAALPELSAPVVIELDTADIPSVSAASIDDAARAEGWLHARDRFLQMDLARRQAAGELGEIVPSATAMDMRMRPLGMRSVARRALASMPAMHRGLLERYAEGVNAFLATGAPLEYRMLKQVPSPWLPEDSMLVQLGMGFYLDGSATADRARTALFRRFPSVAAFLTSSAGPLSMSVDGSPLPAPPPLPTAVEWNLRTSASGNAPAVGCMRDEAVPGSNAFAVAGSRTKDRRAIVGNDMHLALSAPGIWYRVALAWPEARLVGLSLPGVPLIVQGTNGAVAWAFTNLTADLADVILVDVDPADPTRYLVEGGSEPFAVEQATVGSGTAATQLVIRTTRWGPVVDDLGDGRVVTLRWIFHADGAVDCGIFDMVRARTLEQALDVMRDWNGPPQNALVASADGRIGWTIAGSLPARSRATPTLVRWRDAPEWKGVLAPGAKPRIVDPPSGILTSANQLSITPAGELASVIGNDEAPGDRAHRLRERLLERTDWTESELHAVQLDVHSARLVRWRDAMLAALPPSIDGPRSTAARDELSAWGGQVVVEASAPEIIDACRRALRARYAESLGEDASNAIEDEALLRMLESRAPYLAPGRDGDWTAIAATVLAQAADATVIEPAAKDAKPPSGPSRDSAPGTSPGTSPGASIVFRKRGMANTASIRHPAADILGAAARLAEMPRAPLPGHPTCVRVQTPAFGASQRSVVSPSHLENAILVTPCGQSGLPTSPHFRDLHPYWQRGEPYPLLPKDTAARIELSREVPAQPSPTK